MPCPFCGSYHYPHCSQTISAQGTVNTGSFYGYYPYPVFDYDRLDRLIAALERLALLIEGETPDGPQKGS